MPDGCVFRERIASALRCADVALDETPEAGLAPVVEAAVLVPLVPRPEGATILLTRRTRNLEKHAGQISFPGGKIERGDGSPEAAALRETEEEVGLARERIEILGRLARRVTGTGFRVTPVVGLARPPFELRPAAGEVDAVFEVPLAFVLDRGNHRTEVRLREGVERRFHAMPYGDFYIWGLTARLLVALCDALDPP